MPVDLGVRLSGSVPPRDGKVQLWSPTSRDPCSMPRPRLHRQVGVRRRLGPSKQEDLGDVPSQIYEINDSEGFNIHDGPFVCGHYFQSVERRFQPNQRLPVRHGRERQDGEDLGRPGRKLSDGCPRHHAGAPTLDGTQIAVGFGGGSKEFKQKKDGGFVILNERT